MKIWNVQGGEVQVQNLPLENLKSGRPQNPAGKGQENRQSEQNSPGVRPRTPGVS